MAVGYSSSPILTSVKLAFVFSLPNCYVWKPKFHAMLSCRRILDGPELKVLDFRYFDLRLHELHGYKKHYITIWQRNCLPCHKYFNQLAKFTLSSYKKFNQQSTPFRNVSPLLQYRRNHYVANIQHMLLKTYLSWIIYYVSL